MSTSCDGTTKKRWFRGPLQTQETVSEGHRYRDSGYDTGGPFRTTKKYSVIEGPTANAIGDSRKIGGFLIKYKGPILPLDPFGLSYPADPSTSDSALEPIGATAIANCSPTNPVANLSVFLGELAKDGIPSIPGLNSWEKRLRILANAGDEFLNFTFGWAPLIRDIQSTAKAVRHAQTVLQQFEKDAGKVVRRSYAFKTEEVANTMTKLSSFTFAFAGDEYPGQGGCNLAQILPAGELWVAEKTTRRRWFSGAFTYHLPTGYFSRSELERTATEAKKVFGLDLTPETLWSLAPWSWALDWVVNAGDVIQNLTRHAQYGQVLRYGYLMEHSVSTKTYSMRVTQPPENYGLGGVSAPVSTLSLVTETKKRIAANPYGFGITWDGLNATQAAVVAALGLTRSRN